MYHYRVLHDRASLGIGRYASILYYNVVSCFGYRLHPMFRGAVLALERASIFPPHGRSAYEYLRRYTGRHAVSVDLAAQDLVAAPV